jgi:hypothetical protein
MVRLIVLDMLRRMRSAYLWSAAILSVVWCLTTMFASRTHDIAPTQFGIAMSLTLAFLLGPMLACGLVTRAVQVMPLSTRQFWVASWLLGVVVAPACLLAARLAALIAGAAVFHSPLIEDLPVIGMSTLLDVASTGAFFGLFRLVDASPTGERWWRGTPVHRLWLWLLLSATGCVWMWIWRTSLPTRLTDLTDLTGGMIGGAVVLGAFGYAYSPVPAATIMLRAQGRLTRETHPATEPDARSPRAGMLSGGRRWHWMMAPSRLTGLALLLWQHTISAVIFTAVMMLLIVALESWHGRAVEGSSALRRVADLLSVNTRYSSLFPESWTFVLLGTGAEASLANSLRVMRTLPISTARTIALLWVPAVLNWTTYWLASVGVLWLARSGASLPKFDLWLVFVALTVLAYSLRLVTQHKWAATAAVYLLIILPSTIRPGIVIAVVSPLSRALMLPAGIVVAAGLVGVAATVSYYALTRRSACYRPRVSES